MARTTTERFALAIVLAVIVGLLSVSGFTQQISGDLTGTVVDEKGAVVDGAKVEALNPSTGLKLSTTTRGNGEYRLGNVPIGRYKVTVTAPNFSAEIINDVPLNSTRSTPRM